MENQYFLFMFSYEGNITSTTAENSAFKCIKQDTVYNTVNRQMRKESNSFCCPLLPVGHFHGCGA